MRTSSTSTSGRAAQLIGEIEEIEACRDDPADDLAEQEVVRRHVRLVTEKKPPAQALTRQLHGEHRAKPKLCGEGCRQRSGTPGANARGRFVHRERSLGARIGAQKAALFGRLRQQRLERLRGGGVPAEAALVQAREVRRSDNEAVFTSRLFRFGLWLLGIRHQHIAPFTPWQNGRTERFFGSFKKLWRLRERAGTPAEALQGALDVFHCWYNLAKPHQHLDGATPAEAWGGCRKSGATEVLLRAVRLADGALLPAVKR